MSETVKDADALSVATDLAGAIRDNTEYLSEVDGAIGDGDHGINMRKGFERFASLASTKGASSMSEGFSLLGTTLMTEIGGSMGPLYGSLFTAMGGSLQGGEVGAARFLAALQAGRDAVMDIGEARPGDKTMLDALCPAVDAFAEAKKTGASFAECLDRMARAAEAGAAATVGMVAKVGRASRLGERSRGVRDAGATSCAILLARISDSMGKLLA